MNKLNNKTELLVPAGDFDCLRAGVQNGADAIYLGSSLFSARANAKNFSLEELKSAIQYCKVRNVKTHLAINTLISDDEFSEAVNLAKAAYEFGIDAIIVQDLGLAKFLINNFPNLDIHASTQMSVHNLEGVLELEKLGFKRVVLSRELPINEIEYIKSNSSVELEVFIHGAICISYSGQCLFSSLVGGRSGNRGKCAQPCRLPYELLEENTCIDKGYLLSPRDLCGLKYIPELINCGISSLKVEGRMKSPEYVATVTKIYRKYIDESYKNSDYTIADNDLKELLQVFNRGGNSNGHLDVEPNKDLVFSERPDNMGIYVGNVSNYNSNKGHITLQLNEPLSIGDAISIEGESGRYTISELMKNDKNIKSASIKSIVKLGRMKGNIKVGSKVYKVNSKSLFDESQKTYLESSNIKKVSIVGTVRIQKDTPISVEFKALNQPPFYNNINIKYCSGIIPSSSINTPLDTERVTSQFSKLGNTPYTLDSLKVILDDNLYVTAGDLNNIRRSAISMLENKILECPNVSNFSLAKEIIKRDTVAITNRKISVLLETINLDYDYSKLEGFNSLYIPLKFLVNKKYFDILSKLSNKFNLFVYMPTVLKANYKNLLLNNLDEIVSNFSIKGFIISNISGFMFLKDYINLKKYEIISNYTMNVFNSFTINNLSNLGVGLVTPSIELNSSILNELISKSSIPIELVAYGRAVLMNTSYCFLGKTNKCYPECQMRCSNENKYYLKDRLGLKFRILPDNIQTVTSIYNSKITSIDTKNFNVSSVRINILDENIDEINNIIKTVKSGDKLEGIEYTNGNLNRDI